MHFHEHSVTLPTKFTDFGKPGTEYGAGDRSIVFLVEFYIWILHFWKNFGNVRILKISHTIVRAFFLVNLSNLLDYVDTVVWGVFEVAEYESGLKICVAQFLGATGKVCTKFWHNSRMVGSTGP